MTVAAPARRALRIGREQLSGEIVDRARSTPGRLFGLLVALVLLGLATGATGALGVQQRSGLVDGVRTSSGPLTVQAQNLYRSLSDADATAASAFLQGGVESPILRKQYQDDISAATRALAATSASSPDNLTAIGELTQDLPVYTGLVETARSYNKMGLPLGAAYLREASGLMRQHLLPAAQALYRTETQSLNQNRDAAASFPWVSVPVGVLALAGLGLAHRYLRRRTNRVLNVGLLTATAAGLVAVLWLVISWIGVSVHLNTSRNNGSAEVQLLAETRIAALQARADESLTLVARGNGPQFEQDFQQTMKRLAGGNGSSGLLAQALRQATNPTIRTELSTAVWDVRSWQQIHQQLRKLDDEGHYPDAVKLAIGPDPDSTARIVGRLDNRLAHTIDIASGRFIQETTAADASLTGASIGVGALAVLMVVGSVAGLQPRIAEYR